MSNEIIVPLDGSPVAETAILHAAELAKRVNSGLHLVRVHTPVAAVAIAEAPLLAVDPELDSELQKEELAWLTRRAKEFGASVGVPVSSELRLGTPADEIVQAAAERKARLIVCTTHGVGGWAPQWLGSVADSVMRHASCPVLVMSEVAATRTATPKGMLVLLDGSEVSASILPTVKWFAKAFGARIELLSIVAGPWLGDSYSALFSARMDRFGIDQFAEASKQRLDTVAEELRAGGLVVSSIVEVEPQPTRAILEHIERTNPDVVALATYGRGLSRLFMGSVADKVLRTGARPTLCYCPPREVVKKSLHEQDAAMLAMVGAAPTMVL
jgi:nucleotide-binding universal stress UspA family protein